MSVLELQAGTLELQRVAVRYASGDAAQVPAVEVAVVVARLQMESGDPRLMPRRWRAVIVSNSVWHSPVHVHEPGECEQPAGYQTSCLRASSAAEGHRGHDCCKAEEGQAGSDRSGSRQRWTTNFVKLHCLCGDAGRIPPRASPCRCLDS